jgi:UDP-2,3-diacylglucosamine hydrolase
MLLKPLSQRRAMARDMRERSEARHASQAEYGDIDTAAALAWLRAAQASTMIHGHTHRPADHALASDFKRIVLSDWDADARPPRRECLRIDAAGARRVPLA